MSYEFTVTFSLPNAGGDPERYLDALFEAGCDDALAGIGQAGLIALDFEREAADAVEAVRSAIADVRRAIPDAEIVEVSPDLVGMTDIARLLGCSRQNVRKYALSTTTFPKPLHAGDSLLLWHLVDIASWAEKSKKYHNRVGPRLLELAAVTCRMNLELQLARLPSDVLVRDVFSKVGDNDKEAVYDT